MFERRAAVAGTCFVKSPVTFDVASALLSVAAVEPVAIAAAIVAIVAGTGIDLGCSGDSERFATAGWAWQESSVVAEDESGVVAFGKSAKGAEDEFAVVELVQVFECFPAPGRSADA